MRVVRPILMMCLLTGGLAAAMKPVAADEDSSVRLVMHVVEEDETPFRWTAAVVAETGVDRSSGNLPAVREETAGDMLPDTFEAPGSRHSISASTEAAPPRLAGADDPLWADSEIVGPWRIVQGTLLAAIFAGCLAWGWQARGRSSTVGPSTKRLRPEGTLPLPHRGSLHLVSVGDERLVVAVDASGVRSVTLIPRWHWTDETAPAPGEAAVADATLPELRLKGAA